MRGIIVAISRNGVIGLHGKIPWRYPGDLKRFKEVTLGSTVIMGRRTWESIGRRALPRRRNVVITRSPLEDVESHRTIAAALEHTAGDVWFIGGAEIYREALGLCDVLDVTWVPETIDDPDAVRFPPIPDESWVRGETIVHEYDPRLTRCLFTRRTRSPAGE